MNRIRILAPLLVVLASLNANGLQADGVLDATVVPSLDIFFDEKWRYTIPEALPQVPRAERVVRHQFFVPFVLAKGYERGEGGQTELTYNIRVLAPDGKEYLRKDDIPLVQIRLERDDLILLSANHLKISFKDADVSGSYNIQILVKDHVGKRVTASNNSIELVDATNGDVPIDDSNDLGNWIQSYYQEPRPDQINSVFFKFVRLSEPADDSGFIVPVTFFAELYRQNRHLLPELALLYPDEGAKNRFYILHILYLTNSVDVEFEKRLDRSGREVLAKLREAKWPDPFDGIEQPMELDMLWSSFFATGSIRPIALIVRQLEGVKHRGELEKFQEDENRDRRLAMLDVQYRAARWSLNANATGHRLVREYCRFLLMHSKLSPEAKAELNGILSPFDSVGPLSRL